MKTVFLKISLVALLCFMSYYSFCQKAEEFGYYIKGSSVARIPFQLHSNLIIVPIKINDSDTLRFILDTGVSTTIVTDPLILRKQTLKFTRSVKLSGAGEGKALEAKVAIGNTIKMGEMRANLQNIVILNEDILHLSEFVGVPIHGIFGYEVFNNFVVTIDFKLREIMLIKPEKYKYKRRKGEKYDITIEDTKPYANMLALVDNGKEMPIKVLIDTGAGHALSLENTKDNAIQLPEKLIRAQLGRGLNGVINGSLGRVEQIRFGKFILNNVITSYPDSASIGIKLLGKPQRQGNIGCELLRRFKVTFNYPQKYIVLKPVKKILKETFEHDMSGVELRAQSDNLRKYYIENVILDSPAWDAGLREGDEVIFINNEPAGEMSISEIYKLLQKGEGKEVSVLIRRDGNLQFANFILRRMI